MRILLLEPYFTGSHKAWAQGYARHSAHEVSILSLPGQFWKWRMHGGAVTLARRFLESGARPDLLLATDMLDLTTFLALTRNETANLPVAVYFHENQLTYPWSPDDRDVRQKRDHHYGFINCVTALSADRVLFNSEYHRRSFLDALEGFLRAFPDHRETASVGAIADRSEVLPLGLDLARFDAHRPDVTAQKTETAPPLILWNHRWEFDKNPEEFFRALYELADRGLDFRVAVLGECFAQRPAVFDQAKKRLGDRIVRFGYAHDFAEYARWLWRADILPVTSNQDFFGASVVEAIYCGCWPILPRRLAYPELLPPTAHPQHLYTDFPDLLARLEHAITAHPDLPRTELAAHVRRFDWANLAAVYDDRLSAVTESNRI